MRGSFVDRPPLDYTFGMPGVTYDTFERYRTKGLDARRAGQWESARIYLLEAARAMLELSKSAQGEELREARRQMSAKLLELAKDCATAATDGRRPGTAARPGGKPDVSSEAEGGADAASWIVREKPSVRFADVAGLEEVKQDIRLKMVLPFQHPELAAKFGVRPGGGVLLYGPPGTGKTMLAKATAGEVDAAFFRISPADILSKWVGEAEQNIKKLFDAAAAEPRSIIFIDEVEALVPARKDEGSSVMQRVVPQILQGDGRVRQKENGSDRSCSWARRTCPWQLDPAVLRPGRFDDKVYIPLPDLPARRTLLDLYLAHRPLSPDLDLDAVARSVDGYSGADIKYICDRAATIPFLESVAIGTEGSITPAILAAAVADAPRSVTPDMLKRFDAWAAGRSA